MWLHLQSDDSIASPDLKLFTKVRSEHTKTPFLTEGQGHSHVSDINETDK